MELTTSKQTIKSKSILGLDIVRIVAMFLVISVHSFHNGFYTSSLNNPLNFIASVVRWLCMSCVPLFIILSGYLLKNKLPTLKYYKKLMFIFFEYSLCSIACTLFKYFYYGNPLNFQTLIVNIFTFEGAPYSWYVNMYIGLFLLAPFFNILFNNIKDFKPKTYFIIILITVFALPNTFSLTPNYWQGAYPIMYYFIGSYLTELKDKIKVKKIVLVYFILSLSIFQSLLQVASRGIFSTINNYASIFCVAISVSIFMLFYDIECSNSKTNKIMRSISNLSLSTFLVSYIFDRIFYEKFLNSNLAFVSHIPHLLYLVPLIFVCSICLAFIINYIVKLFMILCNKLSNKADINQVNNQSKDNS